MQLDSSLEIIDEEYFTASGDLLSGLYEERACPLAICRVIIAHLPP